MFSFLANSQLGSTLQESSNTLKHVADTVFNTRSVVSLIISLLVAFIAGRLVAAFLRALTRAIGNQADKTDNLSTVNRLRRLETLIVLSIALVRAGLFILALYFWWVFTHPTQQSGALIGASAIFAVILSGVLSPVLRDLAFGSVMMAEHWYGVGDYVTIDPLNNASGVVERVTLRSTKIRSITNGEIVWVPNQNIWGVHVAPKGTRMIALEIFVKDSEKGVDLIKQTNLRLSTGGLSIINQFAVMSNVQITDNLWHITALCEVAPGREWLIDEFAVQVIKDLDEKHKEPILVHAPITRYTDTDAEKRFARTVRNARKKVKTRRPPGQRPRKSRVAKAQKVQ